MLYDLSEKQNWVITATENEQLLSDDFLSNFDVAIFLNPTGNPFSEVGKAAFEKWMSNGKGFVGIHAAADFEYDWAYYGKLCGAYFKNHPVAQEATVVFENTDHPAMKPFKGMKSYTTFDEWSPLKKTHAQTLLYTPHLTKVALKNLKTVIFGWVIIQLSGVKKKKTGFVPSIQVLDTRTKLFRTNLL